MHLEKADFDVRCLEVLQVKLSYLNQVHSKIISGTPFPVAASFNT